MITKTNVTICFFFDILTAFSALSLWQIFIKLDDAAHLFASLWRNGNFLQINCTITKTMKSSRVLVQFYMRKPY